MIKYWHLTIQADHLNSYSVRRSWCVHKYVNVSYRLGIAFRKLYCPDIRETFITHSNLPFLFRIKNALLQLHYYDKFNVVYL